MLCLCGFFLSQDFTTALCLLIAFALLVVALVQFHRGAAPGAVWPPVGTSCKLLLQAAPLVVLFFLVFPRINAGLRLELRPFRSANTAFRIDFPLEGSPLLQILQRSRSARSFLEATLDRLVRCIGAGSSCGIATGWNGELRNAAAEGLIYHARVAGSRGLSVQSSNAKEIQQRITLAPHGARWMFALDRPIKTVRGAMLERGDYLWSAQPIRKSRQYDVASSEFSGNEITAKERAESLEVPASISPAVRDLAYSWTVQDHDPHGVISSALRFFRTQGFSYSLTPGKYDRSGGISFPWPRGVLRTLCCQFRNSDAVGRNPCALLSSCLGMRCRRSRPGLSGPATGCAAWCEVWLPENGWTRVDPTSAVAPGRASLGLTSFLETRIASGQMGVRGNALVAQLLRSGVFTSVRFVWQTLSYEWDTRLLAFDADIPGKFVTSMGIGSGGPFVLIVEILIVAIVLLAIYFAWMQLRTRSRVDRVKALYEYFCRKTARLGVPRDPCEGPLDFARRAAQSLPNESNRIRQIADTYILLRYAPQPVPGMLDRFAKEVNAFGARTRH